MNLQVINLKNGIPANCIKVDRSSVLGNPFDMGKNEALRMPVCQAFDSYFERVQAGEEPTAVAQEIAVTRQLPIASKWKQPTRQAFLSRLAEVERLIQQNRGATFGCWCKQAGQEIACHGDKYVNYFARKLEMAQSLPAPTANGIPTIPPPPVGRAGVPSGPNAHYSPVGNGLPALPLPPALTAHAGAFVPVAPVSNGNAKRPSTAEALANSPFVNQASEDISTIDASKLRYKGNWIAFEFSNFDELEVPITDKFGIQYKTVENFFQACKTTDPNIRQQVAQMSPAQAKKYCGRNGQVQPHGNWESEKLRVMLHALRHKFAPGSKWAERLEQTGEERIQELNNWHDNHWGACICSKCNPLPKLNLLGKLLMHVRQENRQLEQFVQLGESSPVAATPSMQSVGVAVAESHASPSSTAYPSPSGQLRSDLKIVSGGQAWGDREPLEAAQQLGIPTGGWAPAGWLVEGGSDPSLAQFGLKEAPAGNSMGHTYIIRTRLNVQDSDGTVVFGGIDNHYIDHMLAWSEQNPHLQERDWEAYCRQNQIKINGDIGSSRTIQFAHFAGKPWMQFDLNEIGTPQARQSVASQLREWVISSNIQVLNAAGNRGSKVPPAYHGALKEIITSAFQVPIVERLHQSVGQNGTSMIANTIAPVMNGATSPVKEISAGKSCNLPVRIDEQLHPQEIEELRKVLPNLIRQSIGQAYRMGYDQINFSISATDERLVYLQEAIATAQATLDPDIKMIVNLSNQHPQLSRQDSLLIVTGGRDEKTLTFIQNFQQIQIEGYNLNTKSEFLIPPANNPTYDMGKHLGIER